MIIVVTRYFGGTLLGTGGLVRAYSKSASECVLAAGICKYIPGYIFDVKIDYHHIGKIKNSIQKHNYKVIDETYAGHVIIKTLVPSTGCTRKLSN